jgi:hypothetical protein
MDQPTGADTDEAVFRMYPNAQTHGANPRSTRWTRCYPAARDTNGIVISRVRQTGRPPRGRWTASWHDPARTFFRALAADGTAGHHNTWNMKLPKGFFPRATARRHPGRLFYTVPRSNDVKLVADRCFRQRGNTHGKYPAGIMSGHPGRRDYALAQRKKTESERNSRGAPHTPFLPPPARDFASASPPRQIRHGNHRKRRDRLRPRPVRTTRSEMAKAAAKHIEFYEDYRDPACGMSWTGPDHAYRRVSSIPC